MNWESHLCLFVYFNQMKDVFLFQLPINLKSIQINLWFIFILWFSQLISDLIVSFILYWMFDGWLNLEFDFLSFLFSINIAFLIDLIIDWFMREISLLSFLISFFFHFSFSFAIPSSLFYDLKSGKTTCWI